MVWLGIRRIPTFLSRISVAMHTSTCFVIHLYIMGITKNTTSTFCSKGKWSHKLPGTFHFPGKYGIWNEIRLFKVASSRIKNSKRKHMLIDGAVNCAYNLSKWLWLFAIYVFPVLSFSLAKCGQKHRESYTIKTHTLKTLLLCFNCFIVHCFESIGGISQIGAYIFDKYCQNHNLLTAFYFLRSLGWQWGA